MSATNYDEYCCNIYVSSTMSIYVTNSQLQMLNIKFKYLTLSWFAAVSKELFLPSLHSCLTMSHGLAHCDLNDLGPYPLGHVCSRACIRFRNMGFVYPVSKHSKYPQFKSWWKWVIKLPSHSEKFVIKLNIYMFISLLWISVFLCNE